VRIAAQAMTTDGPAPSRPATTCAAWWATTWPRGRAAGLCKAGIGPDDVDVVELHDCFTANELITYEAWA
jgi:sterol carrier protein 2